MNSIQLVFFDPLLISEVLLTSGAFTKQCLVHEV